MHVCIVKIIYILILTVIKKKIVNNYGFFLIQYFFISFRRERTERLAQLVEHHVYTEEVGGSTLLAPTNVFKGLSLFTM